MHSKPSSVVIRIQGQTNPPIFENDHVSGPQSLSVLEDRYLLRVLQVPSTVEQKTLYEIPLCPQSTVMIHDNTCVGAVLMKKDPMWE